MANEEQTNSVLLDFLSDNGYITEEQKTAILAYSEKHGVTVTRGVTESGVLADPDSAIEKIANHHGLEYVRLDQVDIDTEATRHLDRKSAREFVAFPYAYSNGALFVAVPIEKVKSLRLKNDLRRLTKVGVITLTVASKRDILKTIDSQYRSDGDFQDLARDAESRQEDMTMNDEILPDEIAGESSVVKFVDLVLTNGVKDKASDIHFDPQEHALVIRYRVDGVLREIAQAPVELIPEIVSRVKIMSNLDISNTRTPQDGRLEYKVNNRPIDFRVATLPSIYGEKIVMRILDNSSARLALTDLGFSQYNLERFRSAATKPYGVLLVTGPTGSGKSTTLYAALNEIANPDINIITAEDPVEYQLQGITQVHVKHPLTFEQVLRTVLRADPDVILIGEIRDGETANIAMKAGMTGHMVFSTLHTNDASSALTRLGDMGVEPFITGSTVEAIVSQRLVRRLCIKCKEAWQPSTIELEGAGFDLNLWEQTHSGQTPTFYKPSGCKACNSSGYKGRVAIHEVLLMSQNLEEAVIKGAKSLELHRLAENEGMISLKHDGLLKAAEGVTTMTEIARVVA